MAMSQAQVIGTPPMKTWDDYEQGCLATYGGGYRTQEEIEIFHHGISTVFNLLRNEFPPAEKCKKVDDYEGALASIGRMDRKDAHTYGEHGPGICPFGCDAPTIAKDALA